MAAIARGIRFSYVGGRERDKEGLGRVVTGSELRRIDVSPWQLFAVQERKRIAQYFDAHQYAAAAMMLHDIVPHVRERDRRIFDLLAGAAEGYAGWDRFDHDYALQQLAMLRRQLEAAALGSELEEFVSSIGRGDDLLGRLKPATANFKRPHVLLLSDLLANADRRIEEGKHDDAVARLYRALELQGQIAFERVFGQETSKVEVRSLPDGLRDEYARKYPGDDDKLRLPLFAVYRALAEQGDEVGKRFLEAWGEVRKILESRNSSIIAHGLRPIGEEQARKFRGIVVTFLPEGLELPRFPRLPW